MKLFIDTANLKEIEALVPLGIVDGITTNPSLLAREAREAREGDFTAHLKRICVLVQGPVSAEVVGTSAEGDIEKLNTSEEIDSSEGITQADSNSVIPE